MPHEVVGLIDHYLLLLAPEPYPELTEKEVDLKIISARDSLGTTFPELLY
jgi:hypothetical protein